MAVGGGGGGGGGGGVELWTDQIFRYLVTSASIYFNLFLPPAMQLLKDKQRKNNLGGGGKQCGQ